MPGITITEEQHGKKGRTRGGENCDEVGFSILNLMTREREIPGEKVYTKMISLVRRKQRRYSLGHDL